MLSIPLDLLDHTQLGPPRPLRDLMAEAERQALPSELPHLAMSSQTLPTATQAVGMCKKRNLMPPIDP